MCGPSIKSYSFFRGVCCAIISAGNSSLGARHVVEASLHNVGCDADFRHAGCTGAAQVVNAPRRELDFVRISVRIQLPWPCGANIASSRRFLIFDQPETGVEGTLTVDLSGHTSRGEATRVSAEPMIGSAAVFLPVKSAVGTRFEMLIQSKHCMCLCNLFRLAVLVAVGPDFQTPIPTTKAVWVVGTSNVYRLD